MRATGTSMAELSRATRSKPRSTQFQAAAVHRWRTGDWTQWSECFTEDAAYYEHHYGRFEGRRRDPRVDLHHDGRADQPRHGRRSRSTGT